MVITLPDRQGDEGVESRVLLAECRSLASTTYTIKLARECMQLMDAVLWNRMADLGPFLAKGAKTLSDVVKAKGQFADIAKYPDYDVNIRARIQQAVDIANDPKDQEAPPTSNLWKKPLISQTPPALTTLLRVNSLLGVRSAVFAGFMPYKTMLG